MVQEKCSVSPGMRKKLNYWLQKGLQRPEKFTKPKGRNLKFSTV